MTAFTITSGSRSSCEWHRAAERDPLTGPTRTGVLAILEVLPPSLASPQNFRLVRVSVLVRATPGSFGGSRSPHNGRSPQACLGGVSGGNASGPGLRRHRSAVVFGQLLEVDGEQRVVEQFAQITVDPAVDHDLVVLIDLPFGV